MTIVVERYNSKTPSHCFNCQKFGYSSLHCEFAPRCVKCAGPHRRRECKKTKKEEPICSNCEGQHTANLKKCSALFKAIAENRPTRTIISRIPAKYTPPTQPESSGPTIQALPGQLFATVTKGIPNVPLQLIAESLQDLLTNITTRKTDIKDALIATIMAILPLILNNHG